jgi:NAD dependent epimerase/dehydratase family enzyme
MLLGRERADDLLLASQRAQPAALLAAGFDFEEPSLAPYLDRLYAR